MVNALSAAKSIFLQTLAEELKIVQQFVEQLKLEQAALSAGNTDALPEFAERKSQLAVQLGQFAAKRNAALVTQGFNTDRNGIEAWCAKHPNEKSLFDTWAGILARASEARELNRLNGELIQLRTQFNAKALEALRGGNNALDLYGPDGQSTTPGLPRINHSV